jgi:hypothetical protein
VHFDQLKCQTLKNLPAAKELMGRSQTLIPWKRGGCMVWDFTCCDTFVPSNLPPTSTHAGKVAENAAAKKRRTYEFLGEQFIFIPVAVETTVVWEQSGLDLLKHIGGRNGAVKGDNRATSFLLQRMSIAIQRKHGSRFRDIASWERIERVIFPLV